MRALLVLACSVLVGAADADGSEWALSAGSFETEKSFDGPLVAGLELRLEEVKLWVPARGLLVPSFGVAGTEDGALYAYGGFALHVPLGARWRLTPQAAAGFYDENDGKDLGGPLEFRTGLEIAYRSSPGSRIGLVFYHISNAGIYERNPGVNSLAITVLFGGR